MVDAYRVALLAGTVAVIGCGALLGYEIREHADDDEDPEIPAVSATNCADADVIEVDALFVGPYALADDAPLGERIALEGRPLSSRLCTQKGCSFECCDNSCGFEDGCAYVLRASDPELADYATVCLDHDDFACGGTDCSGWCVPFSLDPEHDYRLVGRLEQDGLTAALRVESYCRVE